LITTFIQKYFGVFFAAGIALGFFFPGFFMPVSNWIMFLLGSVITLTFLTLDLRAAAVNLKQFHHIGAAMIISKVVLPFILFQLARPFGSDISIAVLLLTLTPFAGVSPTLTKILGGDAEFILLNQVLLTLLAPLYLPALLLLYAGAEIQIDVLAMMKTLLFLIIIPFTISLIIRPVLKQLVERTKRYYGAANILLISLLLTGIIAGTAEQIKENPLKALPMTGCALILGLLLMFAGWFCFFFLDRKKRIGLSVGNIYMNIGLSAVIAAPYFSPGVMMFILIYELPANILPGLIGKIGLFKIDKD
jgi:BASS family bile acid:Na+ symporter